MSTFKIDVEVFLGYSHCGGITADGAGTVTFTDEEVSQLVSLIKEHGTADVEELNLEENYPTIYEKLDKACSSVAWRAEADHWYWEAYYDGSADYDEDELIDYCKRRCGFEFFPEDTEDLDESDSWEEEYDDDTSEEERTAFYEWLEPYLKSLDFGDRQEFFEEHMGVELNLEGAGCGYEIKIPAEIIALANKS